ncbi:unnamed protein product [Fraxinus pennsylvanica]|uniref:Zinc finger A20 and AN1 domain-containing stress-associated protein 8 n=1 Tax=Fraxinus pennsylvanica TaxID=56036 RepID=A0AAD2ALL3_9LAMI|nr:unnamed protein product [Fraxinus pennsylvanica]
MNHRSEFEYENAGIDLICRGRAWQLANASCRGPEVPKCAIFHELQRKWNRQTDSRSCGILKCSKTESFPTPPTQPPHAALRPYQDTFSSPLKLLQLSLELSGSGNILKFWVILRLICQKALHFLIYRIFAIMESSKETGCQAPECPILCINNCGFFGTAATMNMCSKCHKDTIMKQQHTKLADSSIKNLVNGVSGSNVKEPVMTDATDVHAGAVESKAASKHTSSDLYSGQSSEVKMKDGPNRCTACHKRVGLTGFNCRCGNLFCSVHRYTDKHDCPFDYRMAAQDVIAKANPTVKAEKLDKI